MSGGGNGVDIGAVYQLLTQVAETVNGHTAILHEHTRILNEHTFILNEHTFILNEHTRIIMITPAS